MLKINYFSMSVFKFKHISHLKSNLLVKIKDFPKTLYKHWEVDFFGRLLCVQSKCKLCKKPCMSLNTTASFFAI